jgi:hypothetical protein
MSTPAPRKHTARKLLVAAIGVATVTYAASCSSPVSGNLVADQPYDAGPDTGPDAAPDAKSDASDAGADG